MGSDILFVDVAVAIKIATQQIISRPFLALFGLFWHHFGPFLARACACVGIFILFWLVFLVYLAVFECVFGSI